MRKDIFLCDRCGKELPEDYNPLKDQVRIPIGNAICPASGKSDTIYNKIDVCSHCLAIAISRWFDQHVDEWDGCKAFCELLGKGVHND